MAVASKIFNELFPLPKSIKLLGGDTELSGDIRLITNSVSPLQRKAIRTILNDAGVRVVANKKKYVVNAIVDSPDTFDMKDVPESCRKDYYELTIQGSEITIRTPDQPGTVWASQTAAAIFRLYINGATLPNVFIRDWPTLPYRGLFIENKWGPDRMNIADWSRLIDTMSSMKMNALCIGLYGCWGSCRFEAPNKPTEFLMVPTPELTRIKNQHTLSWYASDREEWMTETYQPATRENEELLTDIINYASEKSITVFPLINMLGHNSLFPREYPEISAKDATGAPTHNGYCTTSPQTKEFLEKLCSSILEKYYPDGAEIVHIGMDEVWDDCPDPDDPAKRTSPICQCPQCRKKSKEVLIQEHIIWLVKMLLSKGVKKVMLYNDQMTRHMSLLDKNFAKRLEKEGIKDKIIIHWWCYNNQKVTSEGSHPSIGTKLGIEAWAAPMTCYYNWSTYDYRKANIDMYLKLAEKEGAIGALSYSVHDPSHLDHEAMLGAYSWESSKGQTLSNIQKRWATAHFKEDAPTYLAAVEKIAQASSNEKYLACLNYPYTYSSRTQGWPRRYPEEALLKLEAPESGNSLDELQTVAALGKEASDLLLQLKERQGLTDILKECILSLIGEAARIQGIANSFVFLLELRKELAPGMIMKRMVTNCQKAKEEFMAQMAIVEHHKPDYIVPATMHALSNHLEFLEQLCDDLKKHVARKQAKQIRWTVCEEEA